MSRSKKDYLRWSDIPYAGENQPPLDPETPLSGSWSTYFIERDKEEGFKRLDGSPISLDVQHPRMIDWDEQLKLVKRTLTNLNDNQRAIAKYWGTGPATKQWTPIADRLIDAYGVEAPRAARILAALYSGLNDAFVVTWYLKFKWQVARPNQYDRSLVTEICTPRHPTYTSGHAGVAGAAEVILSYFFPAKRREINRLAEEAAASRLYGGVHFPVDNEEGLRLGRQIGHIVVNQLKEERNSKGKLIDVPYRHRNDANLRPPPYEQAIPFDFKDKCQSLVADHSEITYNTPQPKLFI